MVLALGFRRVLFFVYIDMILRTALQAYQCKVFAFLLIPRFSGSLRASCINRVLGAPRIVFALVLTQNLPRTILTQARSYLVLFVSPENSGLHG